MRSVARRGMTLIELLTVFVIVALLLALLLGVVLQTRETARRAQCTSHLHNIAVAMHHHLEARGTLPAGSGEASFLRNLLPYLEQENFRGKIDARTVTVPIPGTYLCPSDAARKGYGSQFATNYAGNAGVLARNPVAQWDGVFGRDELSPRDVTDGLSATVAVAEWIVGEGDARRSSRLGSIHILDEDYLAPSSGRDAFATACASLPSVQGRPISLPFKGSYWYQGRLGYSLYTHAIPPNLPSCVAAPDLNAITAGSFHGGGSNLLLLDGSVKFIRDSVESQVWRSLGTRAGGEVVSHPPF